MQLVLIINFNASGALQQKRHCASQSCFSAMSNGKTVNARLFVGIFAAAADIKLCRFSRAGTRTFLYGVKNNRICWRPIVRYCGFQAAEQSTGEHHNCSVADNISTWTENTLISAVISGHYFVV